MPSWQPTQSSMWEGLTKEHTFLVRQEKHLKLLRLYILNVFAKKGNRDANYFNTILL